MTEIAFAVLGAIFVTTEVLHFIRERELIRRLASKNNIEYVTTYEKKDDPRPPSRQKMAMERWKMGGKDD